MLKKNPSYEDLERSIYALKHSLNRISDACMAFDISMNFIVINEAGAAFFESSTELLVGRNFFDLVDEPINGSVATAFTNAIEKQKVEILEIYSIKKNGWFSYRIYPSQYGISVFIHEVSAADRAEAILRKSEVRVRTMLDELPDGVIVADEQTKKFVFANRTICSMLGYSKEELERMKVDDIHPKEDLPIVFREFMRMVSMEHSKASHLPVLRKDGSVFIADIYAVRLELDGVMCLCGVFSDLTEAIASENRILEEKAKAEASENKYRLLFENSPVGVVATDDKGQILLINKKLTELTGYSTLDLSNIDQWWSIAYPDVDYRNQLMKAWNEAVVESMMTKKAMPAQEVMVYCKDGRYRYFEITFVFAGQYNIITFVHVTDYKKAQEKLIEQEERYNQLATHSRTITWEVDKKGLYTYISDVVVDVLGYKVEEVVGKYHFYDLHPEEGRAEFKKAAFAVFEDKKDFNDLVNQIVSKSGKLIWVSTNGIPVFNPDGSLKGYRGSDTDITTRKQSEEALAASEQDYRMLFENMAQGVVYQDAGGVIMKANPAAQRLLGLTMNQMIGRNSVDPEWHCIKEDGSDFPGIEHPAMVALKTAQPVKDCLMGVFIQSKQDYTWLLVNAEPEFKNYESKPYRVFTTFTDITEKKKFEIQLIDKNRQLNLIIQNIPGVVFSCIKDEDCHMLFISDYISEITGYKPNEINRGKLVTFNQLIHPDDNRKLRNSMEKAFGNKEKYNFIYRLLTKDGKFRWVYEIGEFDSFEGSIENKKIDGVLFDLTEKINQEEEKLSGIFKATDAERTRISHEIHDGLQQTLVACKMNLEIVKKEISVISPKLQDRYLTGLEIMDYAIQESRTIARSLLPKHVNDFGFIVALENMISNIDKKIEFKFYHHDIMIKDDAIALNLYRITQEAINNIIKHSQATKVQISLTKENGQIVYTIDDNGVGFNLDDTLRPEKGIGLQSMKSRAMGIGANFDIFSQLGKGTLIVIEFPASSIKNNS